MKMSILSRIVSVLAVAATLLSAQPLRDNVPLRHWSAPLYWQPDLVQPRSVATTATDPAPLTFIAMTPCRVVDTRVGFGFSGAFGPPSLVGGMSRTFPMQSSTTCSIPTTALAYSLNFTVVPPGSLDYLTAYPTGQPQPVVSTLNSLQGFIVANAAIAPAGTSGSIDIFVSNATDLIIDINGYYAASFGTPSGGYQFPNASGTPLLTIAPTGNVGIGTATPGSALDVAGDINFTGTIRYAGAPEIQFINGDNVAVGRYALYAPTGTGNTALGDNALFANTTGSDNTGIGYGALGANTTGYRNTATSITALGSNSTGHDNTATGADALYNNTTGATNTAIGSMALLNNVSGGNNIAIGDHAAFNVYLATSNNSICFSGSEGRKHWALRGGWTKVGLWFRV